MRLPNGWDQELKSLDAKIKSYEDERDSLNRQMETELERVRESYRARMPIDQLSGLQVSKNNIWERIRSKHKIEHPKRTDKLTTVRQAAEVLAHYWQGEELDNQKLLDAICGFGDNTFNARAYQFASNLTAPNSPERQYVRSAQDFLWKDTGR
jgi:hypothetical protein